MARAPVDGSGAAWVLGDAATVRGFRLAGHPGRVVDSPADARAALDELRARGVAVVVLTERLCAALGGLAALAAGPLRPVVAVVPSATPPRVEPSPGRTLAREVRRALGLPGESRSFER